MVWAIVGCAVDVPGESTTDSSSVEETTEKVDVPVELTAETLADYVVIRPETKGSDYAVTINAAKKLRETLNTTFGIQMSIKDDWHKATEALPETAKEILVGPTNRVETQNVLAQIKTKDFVIAFENDRIVITGGSEDATSRAVDYFLETYLDTANAKIKLVEHLLYIDKFDYPMGNISICGVDLSEYTIVYPKTCDLVTYYTAYALSDYILNGTGVEIEVVDDTATETKYELLVGDTNRAASNIGITLTEDQYSLSYSEGKVVMQGDYHMAGAAASTLIHDYLTAKDGGTVDVTNIPTTAAAATFTFKEATSAIIMIGDGMSSLHFDAAVDTGVIPEFVASKLPYKGECTTYSYSVSSGSASYTDSAASATALSSGYKTKNGYVGVTPAKISKPNIREVAHDAGAKTAVVTTDVITGATPAGFLCHNDSRKDTTILQNQINKLIAEKKVDYTYGAGKNNAVKLTNYTREALSIISENNGKFFMMVEEAYIDKNSHNNDLSKTTKSVENYNDAIAYCIAFTMIRRDVLLVITADHDCGNLVKKANGTYNYTSGDHTNKNVPVFALGDGAAELISKPVIDNTDIPKAVAKIFGNTTLGK